jgi:protein TonB
MAYYSETSPTSRIVGFGVVVVLHVAIVWALVTGLATTMMEVVKGPIQVETLMEQKKDEAAPPPPPPQTLKPPPVYVPPVEVNVASEAPSTNAIQAVSSAHTNPKPTPGWIAADDYPNEARHLKAEASVIFKVDCDEKGRVTNFEFVRFENANTTDEAALNSFKDLVASRLKVARFRPATNGGQPVPQTGFTIKVTFRCKAGGVNNC